METQEAYVALGVALGIGFLIGLQREQSNQADQKQSLGGVRTFPLVALAGALCTLLGKWIVAIGFFAVLIPVTLSYADDLRKNSDRGVTTEIGMLVTYLLGALSTAMDVGIAFGPRMLVVSGLGVIVMALLSLKGPLHTLAKRVSSEDIYATLKFLAVAVILLPLLPNRAYGPLQVLNPFHIGTMIVLIAGISFVGYIAVRILGPGKGIGITGLLGGVVSSTAVTLSFSGRVKEGGHASAYSMGVILACSIMPIRVILEVAVVNPGLVKSVAVPMGAMAAGGLLAAAGMFYFARREEQVHSDKVPVSNPFELKSAVKFGLIFAVVLFVSKAATVYWGAGGIYLAGLLAGTTDVDAITLSMAKLSKEGLAAHQAATTILIAAGSNTVVKGTMAAVLGGWAFGRRVVVGFAAMLACGGAGIAWLWLSSSGV